MPSFDVVSTVNMQEVKNAVEQVKKEIATRFDFKGSKSSIELTAAEIILVGDDKMKMETLKDMSLQKLSKRGVSIKSLEIGEPTEAGGDTLRLVMKIKQNLTTEELKRINKIIKDKNFKVQGSIQGDQLRVSGKKKDDLQEVIGALKTSVQDLSLQFINFRD